jgi:hypothetical protein
MDTELREILDKVYANKMKPDEAQWKICVLFNVSDNAVAVCPKCGAEETAFDDILEKSKCMICQHTW